MLKSLNATRVPFASACVSLPLIVAFVAAQPLPHLNAAIQSNVSFDSSSALFTYDYTITNDASSTGRIDYLSIDIARSSGSVAFDSSGLTIPRGRKIIKLIPFDQEIVPGTTVQLIPVGIQNLPARWMAGISVTGLVSWGAGTVGLKIEPGQSLAHFILMSRGIPGVRQATLSPKFVFTSTGTDTSLADIDRAGQIEDQITLNTQVIGPSAPQSLDLSSLIDNLIALKHQSASSGWLTGRELIDDLDEMLNRAKAALNRSKTAEARRELERFIRALDEQRRKLQEEARDHEKDKKHEHTDEAPREKDEAFLSDNAYFLLKTNAEFIVSKLPKQRADDDRDREDPRGDDQR